MSNTGEKSSISCSTTGVSVASRPLMRSKSGSSPGSSLPAATRAAAIPRSRLMCAFIPASRCCSTMRPSLCAALNALNQAVDGSSPERYASYAAM